MTVWESNEKSSMNYGLGFFSACLVTNICEAKGEKEQIPGISSNANSISAIPDTIPWLMGQRSSQKSQIWIHLSILNEYVLSRGQFA